MDNRQRSGNLEVDTIIGKEFQQAIATLTVYTSRLVLLGKVKRKRWVLQ
jgi:IS30 family transposase